MTRLTPEQINACRQLAYKGASCALSFYTKGIEVQLKEDNSPVTQADLAVSALLEKGLPIIADFPVLSEENKQPAPIWTTWKTYWLIDPIDGTKHFINETGDFCICIALIHKNTAVFGLIAAPTTGELWLGQLGNEYRENTLEKFQDNQLVRFPQSAHQQTTVTLSAKSVSKRMQTFLSVMPPYDWYNRGSAIKYIDIAEGRATLYPKLWDTCEWDSAAGHCILACAGGNVINLSNGKTLTYGTKPSLINPHFIAHRDLSSEQSALLLKKYQSIKY